MPDLQRIKFIVARLKSLGHGSQKEIGKLVGYTNESAFSQVLNGKVTTPSDLEARLVRIDERVLNTLSESDPAPYSLPKSSSRIEATPLRLVDPYGIEATGAKHYTLADGSRMMQLPVIPVRAYGSYMRGHADPEFYEGFDMTTIPVDNLHAGTYVCFEMGGKSMVNIETEEDARRSLWPGQRIIGRELNRGAWQYKLHTFKYSAWIIVHRDGIVVKEILDQDVEKGIVTLHSWNPDKIEYPDYKIKLDDVDQIFNVVDPYKKLTPY